MTKFYIANAFSLNMFERAGYDIALRPTSLDGVKNLCRNYKPESIVGHKETAAILATMLDYPVEHNRATVALSGYEWSLIVAQYTGPRLPEGATVLPEGASITFWQVYPN